MIACLKITVSVGYNPRHDKEKKEENFGDKYMRKVAIIGVGQTPVREHWSEGFRQLGAQAILAAMDDAGVSDADALYVGNMLSGVLGSQEHLAVLLAEYSGLEGIEAVKVEAACGSAAAAFRQAVLAVGSGAVDTAVSIGIEKLTEMSGKSTTYGLATAADADYETAVGLSFVAINALAMQRYLYEYGFQKKDFAPFVINAHKNAVQNPNAMFRAPISMEQYQSAKMIADPVNLLDSSPIADGAAACIITAAENLGDAADRAVIIEACEIGTDTIALDNRKEPLWLSGVERSVKKAFKTAGVSHKDIELFELHDAFSIMSALSLESSGFAERGTAPKIAQGDGVAINGLLPISTFGGLKGRGHPVGATGMYQIVEAVQQLRGEAPEAIQVDCKRAMTQNVGGSGATVITSILSKNA